jgi:TetR/AcrR family acrAB operon transcriptional repressor
MGIKNIIKKHTKRKVIAKSCSILLENNQYHDISISKLAQTAGIGKGTIYEYFENKEDIVFELMSCLQDEYDEKLSIRLKELPTEFSKTIALFTLFISEDEYVIKQREIYKQFIIISLSNPSKNIRNYNTILRNKYITILNDIINNKELATKIYDDIISIFVTSNIIENFNLQDKVREYIKTQISNLTIGEKHYV